MKWHLMVGYLEVSNLHALAELRTAYPNSKHMLYGSMKFGEESEPSGKPSGVDREVGLSLIGTTSSQVTKDIDFLVSAMKVSMQRVRRLRFGGALVATLSGAASALLVFLGRSKDWASDQIAVGTAIVTMAGGLCTLFAEHFEKTPTGLKFSGVDEITSLIDLRVKIEKTLIRIGQDSLSPCSDAEIAEANSLLNEGALKVMRLKYIADH
jgi:hypothetical protein